MQTYLVGGAVRDYLLNIDNQDKDWVVTGATVEEMIALGFKPIGKEFPVFIHPNTKEEYALARSEKKTGRGYHGFIFYTDPSVSLQDDLLRRDLTINAMAMDDSGHIIDPYKGQEDLENKILRHVSPAFSEDPVRVLRLARFIAQFGFKVHPTTMTLVKNMIQSGELDYLVKERIWQEFSKGIMGQYPDRMLIFLSEIGLFATLTPAIDIILVEHATILRNVFTSKELSLLDLSARLAILLSFFSVENEVKFFFNSFAVPKKIYNYAIAFYRACNACQLKEIDASGILKLFKCADAFRKPVRFQHIIGALKILDLYTDHHYPMLQCDVINIFQQVKSINVSQLILDKKDNDIRGLVQSARLKEVENILRRLV